MPEALARSHNDSVLSRSPRPARRGERDNFARALWRRLLAQPGNSIAGATLAAILAGILINALALQKDHRPPPSLPARPATSASQPAAAPTAAQGAPLAAQPPVRPAGLGLPIEPPVPPVRAEDPIRELLRGDGAKDSERLTLAAQNALIKLGYSIKADGVVGASTVQAIQQYERAHSLPVSGEITPKLVKQLSAAASAAAH